MPLYHIAPKATRPEKGDQRQRCAPTCNIASLSRPARQRQTRQKSPDAPSLAGRTLPGGDVGISQRHGETSPRSALECRLPALSICVSCLSTQRAKSPGARGPGQKASWLTLLFVFLLHLSLFFLLALYIGRYTASGTRRASGYITCGLQFIPRVLKRPTQAAAHAHATAQRPYLSVVLTPWGLLLFSPCALFCPSILFPFSFLPSRYGWRLG